MTTELYHHGIKGQRWGVRRFQNQNGTLTAAGKKRYNDDGSPKKSNHRLKLEEKYRKSGMSQKQAEMAAERRIKTEKIVAATAGLTLTAAAAYAANKYVKNNVDRMIKSGATLQRIEMQDTKGQLHDVFYAAKDKVDKTKYAGQLGYTRRKQTGHAFKMDISAKGDIKVAARKNAEKVFNELYEKDSDFRKAIEQIGGTNVHGMNKVNANGKLNGKMLSKVYDNFNSRLVEMHNNDTANKFYDALKAKGYNAIQDVNDMKFSGYNAKNPIIVFGAKGKIAVNSMKEMTEAEINKALAKDMTRESAKALVKRMAPYGALITGASALSRASQTKAINDYRRKHPNTDKTDKEIIEMLQNQYE